MNKLILAALLCPLFASGAVAQPVAPDSSNATEGPIMGAYAPAATDNPLVQDARAFIQNHLASMSLNEVTEAYTQVVAGMNVKLVCEVAGEDGTATWQFVAYRSLDGRWHWHSATRVR